MEPLNQNTADFIAEFTSLAAAFEAAGRIAEVTEFDKVRAAMRGYRDRLECRLMDLAELTLWPLQ